MGATKPPDHALQGEMSGDHATAAKPHFRAGEDDAHGGVGDDDGDGDAGGDGSQRGVRELRGGGSVKNGSPLGSRRAPAETEGRARATMVTKEDGGEEKVNGNDNKEEGVGERG